jgi:hypothetical protein
VTLAVSGASIAAMIPFFTLAPWLIDHDAADALPWIRGLFPRRRYRGRRRKTRLGAWT